jgi:hypothetical protein
MQLLQQSFSKASAKLQLFNSKLSPLCCYNKEAENSSYWQAIERDTNKSSNVS